MKVSFFDGLLWAAGFITALAVLVVLLVRGRWKQFPVFTAWIAFELTLTIVLFSLYSFFRQGLLASWYAHVYWISIWPDFALQLGVAIEIARIVLRPTGTWVRDARGFFITAAIGGAVIAGLLSWWIAPPVRGALFAWQERGNLFTSLVICELFAAMSITAHRLGLGWRNHVMALGQGLTAWSGVMLVTNAIQSYFGHAHYAQFDRMRIIAYNGATLWIAIQLWKPEPQRQPISEELQKYILALHSRVKYDLQRLDARD